MVFVDRLTETIHFAPTRTEATAKDVAQLFMDHLIRLHGCPNDVVSNRDSGFVSRLWKTVTALFGSKVSMSSAFHCNVGGSLRPALGEDMARTKRQRHVWAIKAISHLTFMLVSSASEPQLTPCGSHMEMGCMPARANPVKHIALMIALRGTN